MEAMIEAVSVPGRLSGNEVISDLCDRIAEKLSRSYDLRQSDSYARYSAKVTVELQLIDVDVVDVGTEIAVGTPDQEQPSQRFTLDTSLIETEAVEERLGLEPQPSLERCVDGSMPEHATATAKAERRYYTPRNAVPLGSHDSK